MIHSEEANKWLIRRILRIANKAVGFEILQLWTLIYRTPRTYKINIKVWPELFIYLFFEFNLIIPKTLEVLVSWYLLDYS